MRSPLDAVARCSLGLCPSGGGGAMSELMVGSEMDGLCYQDILEIVYIGLDQHKAECLLRRMLYQCIKGEFLPEK